MQPPIVICGYLAGLSHGPKGVAFGYSAVMILWAIPHIAVCVKDTGVSLKDILITVSKPLFSGVTAAALALLAHHLCASSLSVLPRLIVEGLVLVSVYLGILLYGMGQKEFYLDLVKNLKKRTPAESPALASA